jgi:uncharacterized protein YebE (UPF0316 family)
LPVEASYIYVFLARILDVSLSTLRIIYLTRGRSKLAAAIGFVEVMIYVTALGLVVGNLDKPINIVAYGLGFAAGTLVGGLIEEKIAVGYVTVQVITVEGSEELEQILRDRGFGVTCLEGCGRDGPHKILHVLMKRRHLPAFLKLVREQDSRAFISIIDTRKIMGGYFARMKDK